MHCGESGALKAYGAVPLKATTSRAAASRSALSRVATSGQQLVRHGVLCEEWQPLHGLPEFVSLRATVHAVEDPEIGCTRP